MSEPNRPPLRPPGEQNDTLVEILRGVGANGEALTLNQELLKRIIELLLPKTTDDGPTLSELLTALLGTMREMLIVVRRNADGIEDILQRLDTAKIGLPYESSKNGAGLNG